MLEKQKNMFKKTKWKTSCINDFVCLWQPGFVLNFKAFYIVKGKQYD